MDLTSESAKFLLTQGILGFTTLILGLAVVFLYRDNRIIKAQSDKQLADERSKHATEIAAERKALNEVQELRITELRNSMTAVAKGMTTVDNTLAFIQGRAAA